MPAQCMASGIDFGQNPFCNVGIPPGWGRAKGCELQSVSTGLILQVVVGAVLGSGCRCQNVRYLPLLLRGH